MAKRIKKVTKTSDGDTTKERVVTQSTPSDGQDQAVNKLAQVVWFIVGVIVGLLVIRIVLALLGANLDNAFASFIYQVSNPLVAPFRGLLQVGQFQAGVSRLELETIVAVVVYVIIGWLIASAIRLAQKN